MQIILSALKAEAIPLIEYYKLSLDMSIDLQVYNSDMHTLLVTGVGRENVNRTLNRFFEKFKNIDKANFINIGISGAVRGDCEIGEMFLIDKAFNETSKMSYDIKSRVKISLLSNYVTTVLEPIVSGDLERKGLVDMEAYEICEVLSDFNYLDKLTMIKIVSDFMDLGATYLSSKQIQKLIEKKMVDIDKILNDLRKLTL